MEEKKKKICFVTTIASTIEAFLIDLTQYLVKFENYDVTFICDKSDILLKYCNENIHYIPVEMKRGLSLDGPYVIWQLYRIFKRNKFDIVQYSTKNASTYGSIAAWLARVPCRLYCQWGMMWVFLHGFLRHLIHFDECLVCKLSTAIEAESFSIYNEAIKRGVYKPHKGSVIWNGSACGVKIENYCLDRRNEWRDEIRNRYEIPQNSFVFGWCGRITRDKGHNELLSAFREINKTNKVARLLMVGAYDNVETIDKDLWAWAQGCSEVIFTGSIPREDIPKMYSAMDVFCSLSYREGFGLVVIEAAAMQLPSIVTDVLGQMDTHINLVTGLTVHAHEVECVIGAMRYCIANPEICKKMGIEARKQVEEKFDQRELLRRLAEHRNELIKNSI